MAGRRRKRSDLENNVPFPKVMKCNTTNYREGAIRKIVLHNFLTFDDVTVLPSPQLNVIVGPNGTGKSSLVCAMCIGLAGPTSLLGRAKDLKDFVKHGNAKEGFVEITLHHNGGHHPVIKRTLYKEKNTSKWSINGSEKREQDVKRVVKEFNVQLENKCQFLPQDKVVEFAKLDCYKMLEETEKAIGTEDMFELHQKLKQMKDKKLELEKSLSTKRKEYETMERENQLLERDVRRIRTRQESLLTIKHLKWKKSWMLYEEARIVFLQSKEKRRATEQQLKLLHQQHKPLKEKLKQNEAIVQKFQSHQKEHSKRLGRSNKAISQLQSNLLELSEEQNDACRDYEQKKIDREQQQVQIDNLNGQIESLTRDLESQDDPGLIERHIQEKNHEIQIILQDVARVQSSQQLLLDKKLQQEEKEIRAQNELSRISDVYQQRMEKLRSKDRDTYEAVKWLNENRNLFQKPVHEPVLILLHIKNMQYASQIEHYFSGKDALSFIFECREDYETFAREVRDKKDLRVNMVRSPSNNLDSFKCAVPMETLRQFGFEHMLIDLMEAPPSVLSYFCTYYHLHNIPVANNMTVEQITAFTSRHPNIQTFFTRDQVYSVSRSKYRTESITRSDQIKRVEFYLSSVNDEMKSTLLQDIEVTKEEISKIKNELRQLDDQENHLRQEDSKLRKEKTNLREKLNNRRRLKRTIEQRQIQVKQLQDQPINLTDESAKLKEAISSIVKKRLSRLQEIASRTKECKNQLIDKVCTHYELVFAEKQKQKFESRFQSVTNELKEAESTVSSAKKDENDYKEIAREKMNKACRLTGVRSPEQLPSDVQTIFQGLPEDVAIIEEQIHEHQTKVDMCSDVNDSGNNVVEQYELRVQKMRELSEMIQEDEAEVESHEEETKKLKEQWLEPLKIMITEVNRRFSDSFTKMGCTGEVSLLTHEYDFSKYGVQIRVKFRTEDDLHVLDAQRQSGGERSVSTMMYLMALQDITSCPFRVVDEINQGMDSNNERRVFDLIVDAVGQEDTSQYFLLTPKLLQNLKYSSAVTVHIIHNGVEMTSSWPSLDIY